MWGANFLHPHSYPTNPTLSVSFTLSLLHPKRKSKRKRKNWRDLAPAPGI
jgi:hypothetical protein